MTRKMEVESGQVGIPFYNSSSSKTKSVPGDNNGTTGAHAVPMAVSSTTMLTDTDDVKTQVHNQMAVDKVTEHQNGDLSVLLEELASESTKDILIATKCDADDSTSQSGTNQCKAVISESNTSVDGVNTCQNDNLIMAKPVIMYLNPASNLDLLASVASPDFGGGASPDTDTDWITSLENGNEAASTDPAPTDNKKLTELKPAIIGTRLQNDDEKVGASGKYVSGEKRPCSDSETVNVKKRLVMKINNQNGTNGSASQSGMTTILLPQSLADNRQYAVPLCLIVNPSDNTTQLNITLQNVIPRTSASTENYAKTKLIELRNLKLKQKLMAACKKEDEGQTSDCNVSSSGLTSTSNGKGRKADGLKFPPCVVCGGDSSGYHYGRNTCEACKNFFRRCLLRKDGVNFICTQGKECEISYKKNKNNCSACRYNKCTTLGMSKEKCKMGRYTYSRRTETINQVRKLEGKDADDGSYQEPPSVSSVDSSNSAFESTLQDHGVTCSGNISTARWATADKEMNNKELIEHLLAAIHDIRPFGDKYFTDEEIEDVCRRHYHDYMHKISMFGPLGGVSMEEYNHLLRDYGIDIGGQFEMLKRCSKDWDALISRYCKFAKKIPGFTKLNYNDQSSLLKSTNPSFFTVLMYMCFKREYNVYIEVNGEPYHVDETMDRFISRQLLSCMTEAVVRVQDLNPTKIELGLLQSIITMSGDSCTLENRTLVDNMQYHLTMLLYQEIIRDLGHSAGVIRFSKYIDLLTDLKDVTLLYQKEYKAMCDDSFISKEIPNLDVLKPDEI